MNLHLLAFPRAALPRVRSTAAPAALFLATALLAGRVFAAEPARTPATLTLFAGGLSGQGYRDGSTAVARFSYPIGLTTGVDGDVYIADSRNSVIRRVHGGSVTTFAGTAGLLGCVDAKGAAARFTAPADVAADRAGNLYVADSGNHVIRRIAPDGTVSTLAGVAGQSGAADGDRATARFNSPTAVGVDAAGNVFVGDGGNQTIRRISPDGHVTTFAGSAGQTGTTDGKGQAARFSGIGAIAVDRAGTVYVAEMGSGTIRRITPDGMVSTLAGAAGQGGITDGRGAAARFSGPGGIACDATGNVFVADSFGHTIRRVAPDGTVTTIAGRAWQQGSVDGKSDAARFKGPARLAVAADGMLLVTDNNGQLREISPDGVVTTIAGAPAQSGTTDGPALAARFNYTNGVAFDPAGNLYVVDMDNGTVRKITPQGLVSTFAGTPGTFGNANGRGAAAQFGGVGAITADRAGNLYVTEFYNHAIRKISPEGDVTLFAGTSGKAGPADGTGAAAEFSSPNAIDADAAGNLYVADYGNQTVRKITPAGVVTTIAGVPGKSGHRDGSAASALFDEPAGVAADDHGNVYVTELTNHTVRRISADGIVTTVAGAAKVTGSTDGRGAEARFNQPWGIAVDAKGTLYVCDSGNNAIRRITEDGKVMTLAGGAGPYWNEPGPLPAKLGFPISLTIQRRTGDLFITVPDAVLRLVP